PGAVRLTGSLDAGALERSLREIVRRHEVFRTRFVEIDGQPLQIVSDEDEDAIGLAQADLRTIEDPIREARVRETVAAEASRPFDLERGPLLRAVLLRTGEKECV